VATHASIPEAAAATSETVSQLISQVRGRSGMTGSQPMVSTAARRKPAAATVSGRMVPGSGWNDSIQPGTQTIRTTQAA
jgi:lipoate synthase